MGKPKHVPMYGTIHNCWTPGQAKIRAGQSKAADDRQQSVLVVTTNQELVIKDNPSKLAKVQEKGIDPFIKTRCPFCLCFLPLSKFLITKYDRKGRSKGYDRGRGKCPECGQGMHLKTLVLMRKWTIENPAQGVKEYAAWVYGYRQSGFFQKIKFAAFNSMLKSMKWSREFWDEYKRLKGDLPSAEQVKKDEDDWAGYEGSFQ